MRRVLVVGLGLTAIALGGCQPPRGVANQAFYSGAATPNVGGTATCRSGLTGNIYTVHGAGCSNGDTPVPQGTADAPAATATTATTATTSAPPAVTGWRAKKVPVSAALQKAIEDAVRNSLKDPDSARFKHSVAFKDGDKVVSACGMVNAKNSYGGYVGFEPYRAFVGVEKGKYSGAAAVFGGGKYPQVFFEVNPMCDPKNW